MQPTKGEIWENQYEDRFKKILNVNPDGSVETIGVVKVGCVWRKNSNAVPRTIRRDTFDQRYRIYKEMANGTK